ncbi:MAG: ATP-dependent DNA helicase PcrA, partial [Candidatus Moraniibacteriota bacterium]
HNAHRSKKKIWTDAGAGQHITMYEAHDEREEAQYIVETITQLLADGYSESDFVVLYRTNAQSRVIEECFLKANLNYRIVGGIKFYERKEVKDILSYLALVANGADTLALRRATASVKRGIGNKTFDKWVSAARDAGVDPITFGGSDALVHVKIAKSTHKKIADFCRLIMDMRTFHKTHTVSELILYAYEKSGYKNVLLDGSTEGETRHENVKELLSVATKYDDIDNALQLFIEEVSLASDTDHINQNTNMVHLMTLHSAKGLEFPVVFIAGVEEGLIPHNRSMVSDAEMEEERRLIYVGITRAKKKVFLIHAHQRLLFGSVQGNLPSRFLDDIPARLVEAHKTELP